MKMLRNPTYFNVNKDVKICSELFKSDDFIVFWREKTQITTVGQRIVETSSSKWEIQAMKREIILRVFHSNF